MDMDLDVEHYTVEELAALLDLKVLNHEAILQAIDAEIEKHEKNKDLVLFFKQAQEKLLKSVREEPVSTTFQSDVKRGTINPDLKPTVTRFINIDSACRVILDNHNLSSDTFEFELTETLLNVVSISLYSVEIPQAWYNNTKAKGTDRFVVCRTVPGVGTTPTASTTFPITIPEGNYSTIGLPLRVAQEIQTQTGMPTTATVDPYTSIVTFTVDTGNTTDLIQFVWFDETFPTIESLQARYNSNLGWMLGFRLPLTTCKRAPGSTVCTATPLSPVDVHGTKYIIMSLNDHKPNRINRSMVSVNTAPDITINTPSYYNESIPMYRKGPNISQVHVFNANPKQLTGKQVYTINAISGQRKSNVRSIGHSGSDTFAKSPCKKVDWNKTENGITTLYDNAPVRLFVDAGGPLQLQMREYFGPVDITQLSISLFDDKGRLLGMNGVDWSCTLLVKCIYQYA